MTLLPSLATEVVMLSTNLLSGRLATNDLAHRRAPGQVTAVAAPLPRTRVASRCGGAT